MAELEPGASTRRWLGAGTAALIAAAFAALSAVSAPAAYADVTSSPYTIGTPTNSVSRVVAQPANVVQGSETSFRVRFRATATLAGADGGAVYVSSSAALSAPPTGIALVDDTQNGCFQAGTDGGPVSANAFSVQLMHSCQVAPGDQVEVDFDAGTPPSTGTFYFSVTTSANTAQAASNPVIVSATPPTLSASSAELGANAGYTLSDASWEAPGLSQPFSTLVLTARATMGTTISWYPGMAGYSVSYVGSNGVVTPDMVANATVTTTLNLNDTVTLALVTPLSAGDYVTVSGRGTNPATTSSDEVSVAPASGPTPVSLVGPVETSSNEIRFGTAVTDVTVSASPPVAGAMATYVVSFQATTNLVGGSGAVICLNESGGPTLFSTAVGELVTDTTAGWHMVPSGTTFPTGSPPANPGCGAGDNGAVVPLAAGNEIRSGDSVTLTLVDVVNPAAGRVSDFAVSTSSDTVGATASAYTIGTNVAAGVLVTVNPSTTGSLATYTISNLVASAAMTAGTSTLAIQAPAGTVFPNNSSFYTVQDSTTAGGSGTATGSVTGGGTNDVVIKVPGNVDAGDALSLTIQDAFNPGSASTGYSLTVLGNVTGSAVAAAFPRANITYPNGAIVDFSGTDYVFAGGHAFGIPSSGVLAALRKVDHTPVQAAPPGSSPPRTVPRPGTLVSSRPLNGDTTIYVAGVDGDLHGFATPEQFMADGYDPALVVTVPSLGGLTVGAPAGQEGSAVNALATSADGAIVVSGGTYYVFAGGRAFGIPNPASLARVRHADRARALSGTIRPAQTSAAIANGVLFSTPGPVCVSYSGNLWPFKSPGQLVSDGYSGTAAIPVPATRGLALVLNYAGS